MIFSPALFILQFLIKPQVKVDSKVGECLPRWRQAERNNYASANLKEAAGKLPSELDEQVEKQFDIIGQSLEAAIERANALYEEKYICQPVMTVI